MKELVAVFVGGGFGSILRFSISRFNPILDKFPIGTFFANMLSCLVFGLVVALIDKKQLTDSTTIKLLLVGFCGGFSTFSTFTAENERLLKDGHYLNLSAYLLVSFVICIVALRVGYKLGDKL